MASPSAVPTMPFTNGLSVSEDAHSLPSAVEQHLAVQPCKHVNDLASSTHSDTKSTQASNGLLNESTTCMGLLPLNDRVAIVTGGSGGIGSAITSHLASLGAKVVVGYAGDPNPAVRLVSEINSTLTITDPRAILVEADVSDQTQVKLLFDKAQQAFGPNIHIFVAAHGVQDPKYPFLCDTTLEQWEWAFNINAKGTFLCCREAAKRLARGGGGRIITISSSTVGSIRPGYSTYSASKGAIEVMTKVLAKELRGTRITANCVAPGPIATPLLFAGKSKERIKKIKDESPMGRLGEPKDVAPLLGFLASDAGEWVNGQVIRVNGGYI